MSHARYRILHPVTWHISMGSMNAASQFCTKSELLIEWYKLQRVNATHWLTSLMISFQFEKSCSCNTFSFCDSFFYTTHKTISFLSRGQQYVLNCELCAYVLYFFFSSLHLLTALSCTHGVFIYLHQTVCQSSIQWSNRKTAISRRSIG